jgi:hydroxymethylpyrimidine pyrophosphatase-like HAD family hydrolase
MVDGGEKDTPEFDWVTGRALCSLSNVFKQLKTSVKQDVITRNGLRPTHSTYEFAVIESGNNFTVTLEGSGVLKSIAFSLAEHAIVVKDDKGYQIFDVAVNFNEKGECKLIANEVAREMWEIRRMALEELLFRTF